MLKAAKNMTPDKLALHAAGRLKSMTDAEWSAFVVRLQRLCRGSLVVAVLFVGLQTAGAPFWKSIGVAALTLTLYQINVGARRMEQLCIFVFALLAVYWLDLVPLQRWATGAFSAIDRQLNQGGQIGGISTYAGNYEMAQTIILIWLTLLTTSLAIFAWVIYSYKTCKLCDNLGFVIQDGVTKPCPECGVMAPPLADSRDHGL